jgi:glycosyltransferase involved in cell wall biosynthesis
VLHVLGTLNVGGLETRTLELYRAIDKSKVHFDFAIHTQEGDDYEAEVLRLGSHIFRMQRLRPYSYLSYKSRWRRFFAEHAGEYDVVHCHMTTVAGIVLAEAQRAGIKMRIAHARESMRGADIRTVARKFSLRYATDLLAVSQLAATGCFGKNVMSDPRLRIMPNAIETEKYKFSGTDRDKVRQELGVGGSLVIGNVGNLHPWKNQSFLIDVLSHLRSDGIDACLVIAGDGPLKDELTSKASELNLAGGVKLIGKRRDVPAILSSFDIFAFPSYSEGLPGSVLEAQASGLPCIISDDVTEEVVALPTARRVSLAAGADGWTDIIKGVHISDSTVRGELNEEFKTTRFDINTLAAEYEKLYR